MKGFLQGSIEDAGDAVQLSHLSDMTTDLRGASFVDELRTFFMAPSSEIIRYFG